MKGKGIKVYLCVNGEVVLEKMGLKMNNLRVVRDRVQCQDFVNAVMNLLFL